MFLCLRKFTECFSQRLAGGPSGVQCADPFIRTRLKAATIASASRSTTNRADHGSADIPGANRDLVPPQSSITPFSQNCGVRSWTSANRVYRLRMHPASARSMGLI